MGCTRCHDHKFDPFTQREFYQLFAFFNNVPERGRAIKVGNSPPMIPAPTRDQQRQLEEFDEQLHAAERDLAALADETRRARGSVDRGLHRQRALDLVSGGGFDRSFSARRHARRKDRRQTDTTGRIAGVRGRFGRPGAGARRLQHARRRRPGQLWLFRQIHHRRLDRPQAASGTILARMSAEANAEGYSLQLADGRLQVNLSKRWLDDALRVETAEPIALERWQHVAVTYDGSRVAAGVRVYVDGELRPLKILLDDLNQTFSTNEPLKIGGGGPGAPFQGQVDDVRIYKAR